MQMNEWRNLTSVFCGSLACLLFKLESYPCYDMLCMVINYQIPIIINTKLEFGIEEP
jgi:hypothetical protein